MRKLEDIGLERKKLPVWWMEILTDLKMFAMPLKDSKMGNITTSEPLQWEHVSMETISQDISRCPTYEEMCLLKYRFFSENEITLQVHPAKSEYVNKKKYMLHLWRNKEITTMAEERLRRKICKTYEEAKKYFSGERKEIYLPKCGIVIIFCGEEWLSWEEVCKIKQRYWDPEEVAVQFNVSRELDCNEEHMILLWDATDFDLPPKDFV